MSLDEESNPSRTAAPLRRECFVTVGATASFKGLIKGVMAPEFVTKLIELDYTRLVIQCGPDMPLFQELKDASDLKGLEVSAFDFNKTGLGQEMRGCKENVGVSKMGVVVSHAGKQIILASCHKRWLLVMYQIDDVPYIII